MRRFRNRNRMRAMAMRIAVAAMTCVAFLASCEGGRSRASGEGGEPMEMRYSEHLSISEHDGFTEVTVRNPWDTVRTLRRYLLVPRDSVLPERMPEGVVVRVPVDNALVYSTVHQSLISELGALESIGGLCNSEYVNDPEIRRRVASGRIMDCGLSANPDRERIIQLRPQAILLSPYENNDNFSGMEEMGIPVIECADYMETSPLGRAEWMRFYGLLFGASEKSEQLFAATEAEYMRLRELALSSSSRPKVIFDQRYGQVWSVPTGRSTSGRLVEDAGGVNPFAGLPGNGSVALSPEKVLGEAHDADIWFVRYNQTTEKTLSELASDAPVNASFKAFKEGDVYGCNTRYVNFFEETPFHPDRLLRDMIEVMHPGLTGGGELHYYHKMR